ncbi:MAG: mucoidy inhibitor MuiA family protein [Candidatus Omnitrophota bacterium]
MKKSSLLSLFLVFFVSFASYCFAQDIQTSSVISSVTVYPDSALINRSASLKLEKGEHSAYFPDIVPDIDENSLRVSGKGMAQVKIFGAQLKKEFLENPQNEKITQLQDEIQKLGDYIKSLDDEKQVLLKEVEFLNSVKLFANVQIPKDMATKMPQASELKSTTDFLSSELGSNFKRQLEIDIEKRQVNKKIAILRNELSQLTSLRGGTLIKRSIVVDLEVVKAGTFDLTISYLVHGVSWNMIYDARVAIKENKVELVSYGVIRQKSGEDWFDVDISLSTVKPSIGGRMPYVAPWLLRPYESYKAKSSAIGGALKISPAVQYESFAPGEDKLNDAYELDEIVEQEASYSYAEAQQKGTAIVYNLPKKASIKSDGADHKLSITSQILKPDFQYSTCPKISPFAYLGCRVTNSEDFQLLAGRVNVFLEGDYVGASSIDNIGQGESFDLYLGVDEGVKIERKEVERKVDDILFAGISSPNIKTSFAYKIKVENYKSDRIKVNLFEPMPVSQDDKIVVKIGKVSIQPTEKDWKDRKGVWKWEIGLTPKEKKEVSFSYIVEHPRNIQVPGI